jgi:hypothetical protein
MLCSLLLWVALAACRTPDLPAAPDPQPSGPAWAPPPAAAPPPPVTLAQDPLLSGIPIDFVVRPLLPGETAHVVWSPSSGPVACGPLVQLLLQGGCLGLGRPVTLLGSAVADLSGAATLTVTLTPPATAGPLYTQAVVQHLDGSVSVSEVLERPLLDPAAVWVGDAAVTDAADLAALAGIVGITGDLVVQGTTLSAVDLPDLTTVGGTVQIWENPDLVDLALPALTWVGGDVSLYDDVQLASLSGLSGLQTVGRTLSLNRLPALTDLAGLEQLRTIGEKLYLFHDEALVDTDALTSLRLVGTQIDLWELVALERASLPALEQVGAKLDVFDARAMTELSAPMLHTAGGLELHNAEALTSAGDFGALSLLGSLTIKYNDALVDLGGLTALQTINGAALVQNNPSLQALTGLDALVTVGGRVEVRTNTALTDLALPALQTTGPLEVMTNRALTDLGLDGLQTIDGDALVGQNDDLSTCAVDALFDRVTVTGTVLCGGNLDDGCSAWCAVDTGGP